MTRAIDIEAALRQREWLPEQMAVVMPDALAELRALTDAEIAASERRFRAALIASANEWVTGLRRESLAHFAAAVAEYRRLIAVNEIEFLTAA